MGVRNTHGESNKKHTDHFHFRNDMTLYSSKGTATLKSKSSTTHISLLLGWWCTTRQSFLHLRGHYLKFPVSREQTRVLPPSAIQPFNMRFPTAPACPRGRPLPPSSRATAPWCASSPPSINDVTRRGGGRGWSARVKGKLKRKAHFILPLSYDDDIISLESLFAAIDFDDLEAETRRDRRCGG